MGGFGVIHAGFLVGGAALVAVPVVIHLLFRRRAPRVDLGSLRFLQVALRDNARRRKVRRWLLLALRAAAVLLLGLLFARPYRSEPEVPGRDRELAILIDRSASMGGVDPARAPFGRAREAADRLARDQPEGAEVHLAWFDAGGVAPIPPGQLDSARAAGSAATDYAGAVAWARDRMVASRRKSRRVVFITDLQRSGLGSPPSDAFPAGVDVEVVDVGRPVGGNLAVVEATAPKTEIRPDAPPVVACRVFNAGPLPARGVTVRLELAGGGRTYRAAEVVAIPAGSSREVRFTPEITEPGLYRGQVEVTDEGGWPFDDRRWLAFEARIPERILLVDGDPGTTPYGNETYYLEAALRLRVPGAGPSATPFEPIRYDRGGATAWPDLAGIGVVVLANVAGVSPAEADSLRRFVAAGGRLVLFAGARSVAGDWASLRAAGLLPAAIEGAAAGPARFDTWEVDHPLLRPFADPQHGDLRAPSFSRVARLRPLPGSRVLASARGELPLLVESAVGRGLVLQWAVAADPEWGDWPIQRLYLPIIHQMMGYLTGRLAGAGPIRPEATGPAAPPGIEAGADRLIVRNVDPAESRTERASVAQFRAALRLPDAARSGPAAAPIPLAAAGGRRPGEFWRPVAWALLVALVAEVFLANRTPA